MLKKWLNTAIVFSLLAAFYVPAQASAPAGGALQELLTGTVIDGFDAIPSPEELTVPMPVRENTSRADWTSAPAPGKEFSPTVHDPVRVKVMMKLITDIHYGNQLQFSQDGAKFGNREKKLPIKPYGYYREYTLIIKNDSRTVKIGDTTYKVGPKLSYRGAERFIIGGGEEIYYTPDHYKTFILLSVVY